MTSRAKTLLIWTILVAVLVTLLIASRSNTPTGFQEFDTFLEQVQAGMVYSVRVIDNEIHVETFDSSEPYLTLGVLDNQLIQELSDQGVIIRWGEEKTLTRQALLIGLPVLLFVALLIYFLRKAQGGASNILSLTRSKARLISEDNNATFADVGGCEQAKASLSDVIHYLKEPARWLDAGVRLPRGVLLEGPPGCGKTLLARAVAGETDAKFFLVAASEFVEMFVGVGAARIRDMFEQAAKQAPAVIFIDELDAVGRKRGSGIGASHDEREQTLNQLLVCMDGFEKTDRVVVIAASNRPDVLDPALLRPGRFDRRIHIGSLSRNERIEVLEIHTRNKKMSEQLSLEELAETTEGYSGAALESLANEAAMLAMRRARSGQGEALVEASDFQQAKTALSTKSDLFNAADALLIESATQLAESTSPAYVQITLGKGGQISGRLLWADAAFLKLRLEDGSELVTPKIQIQKIEVLPGTGAADPQEIAVDHWAGKRIDTA